MRVLAAPLIQRKEKEREKERERERGFSFSTRFRGLGASFFFISFRFVSVFFRPTFQKLPGRKVRFVAPRPLIKENGARGCCAVVVAVVVVVVAVVGVAAVGGGGHRDGAEAGSRAEPSRP